MLISIIIPAKNEEKYLPKLLESIRSQNFPVSDYEVIVADNFSTDRTREIAKKYGCKITDGGLPGKARNNGAKIAKGEYLLFLDADVILPSPFFMQSLLEESKKKNLAGLSVWLASATPEIKYRLFFLGWNALNVISQYFRPQAAGPCILALKKCHEAIGGFDETIYFGEDSDYSFRMSKAGKFGILREIYIYASPRRFREDGFLKTFLKIIIGGTARLFFGEDRSNRVKYFKEN